MNPGALACVWFSGRFEVCCSMQHVKTWVTLTIFNGMCPFIFPVLECMSSLHVVTRILWWRIPRLSFSKQKWVEWYVNHSAHHPFGCMKWVHNQSISPTLVRVQAKYIREINTFSRNSSQTQTSTVVELRGGVKWHPSWVRRKSIQMRKRWLFSIKFRQSRREAQIGYLPMFISFLCFVCFGNIFIFALMHSFIYLFPLLNT